MICESSDSSVLAVSFSCIDHVNWTVTAALFTEPYQNTKFVQNSRNQKYKVRLDREMPMCCKFISNVEFQTSNSHRTRAT